MLLGGFLLIFLSLITPRIAHEDFWTNKIQDLCENADNFYPFLIYFNISWRLGIQIIPFFTFRCAVTKREREIEIKNKNFLIVSKPCCIDGNAF